MSNLAYDVGGFNGDDTAHYLDLGFRVVCVEASPNLADKLRSRFATPINEDRCTVLNVAVGECEGQLPFYICDGVEELNSFDRTRIEGAGLKAREITVPVRPFQSIIAEHGVPHFLKVDIEGADRHAILPLTREMAPQFVSFEAGKSDLDLILHLYGIGFRKFNIIRQDIQSSVTFPSAGEFRHIRWSARQWTRLALRRRPKLHGSLRQMRELWRRAGLEKVENVLNSGLTPMEQKDGWRNIEEMLADWAALISSGLIETAWYDVHAAI